MSQVDNPPDLLDQLGAHTFIWAPQWLDKDAERAASGAARAGLSIVEIPLLNPAALDVGAARSVLDSFGLTPTCSLGLPANAHAPSRPEEALAFLKGAIDVAAALGSQWLTGALYGHLGRLTGQAPTDKEIATISDVLRSAADYAATSDLTLGIEIINRYETYLVNTAQQATELLDAIDRPNLVAHLDTFHANLEEADIAAAVRLLGKRLGYVHLGESNRGVIGTGLFPFDTLLKALSDVGFAGPIVIEAFMNASPDLLRATASWRNVGGEPDEFLAASLEYLKSTVTQLNKHQDL